MIIMPHIDGCTIVTENGFCSVMGHPFDIIEGLFIQRLMILQLSLLHPQKKCQF